MSKPTVVICDWGLAGVDALNGNSEPLQDQRDHVAGYGLDLAVRINVPVAHSWDTAAVFWSGHPYLEQSNLPDVDSLLTIYDHAGYKIIPVLTDYIWPSSEGYNGERYAASTMHWKERIFWLENSGLNIAAIQIENEPYCGSDPYDEEEYKVLCRQMVYYTNETLNWDVPVITTKTSLNGKSVGSAHVPIGDTSQHEFPPYNGLQSIEEMWVLPGQPLSRYVEAASAYKNKRYVGFNFGSQFIPSSGLTWLGRKFKTFFEDEAGWKLEGNMVISVLSGGVEPGPGPQPEPPGDPCRELKNRVAKIAARLDEDLEAYDNGEAGWRPIVRQVRREIPRLEDIAKGGK